jgi:hypothetical protein
MGHAVYSHRHAGWEHWRDAAILPRRHTKVSVLSTHFICREDKILFTFHTAVQYPPGEDIFSHNGKNKFFDIKLLPKNETQHLSPQSKSGVGNVHMHLFDII